MNGFSNLTVALNAACQRYAGLFHEEDHPRQQQGLFATKGQGSSSSAPGVDGQQQGLFGNEDLKTGQKTLFNVADQPKPKRGKIHPDSIKSITAGLDAKLKAILEAKPTVSPADRGIVVQAPSLPGQKEMFARSITAALDRYANWREADHPRTPAGSSDGGRFTAKPGAGISHGPTAADLNPHGVKAKIDAKSGNVKVHGLTAALDHWWKENGLGSVASPTAQDVADRGLKAVRGDTAGTVKLKGLTAALDQYLQEKLGIGAAEPNPESDPEAKPAEAPTATPAGKKFQSDLPAEKTNAADLKVGDTILWPHTFGPPPGTPMTIENIEAADSSRGMMRTLTLNDGTSTRTDRMRPNGWHYKVTGDVGKPEAAPESSKTDAPGESLPAGVKNQDGILVNEDGHPVNESGQPLTGDSLRDERDASAGQQKLFDEKGKSTDLPAEPATPPQSPEAVMPQQPLHKTEDGRHVGAAQMHFSDLQTDPERFQYKSVGVGEDGVTDELRDVAKFNPMLGGQLLVWHDPSDGKSYVINGHHRHELASRSGEHEGWDGKLSVYFVDAKDPVEARAHGALTNIAEGRGTAIDAAKFLRDSQLTPEEMESQHGISLKGKMARDGAALTKLSDRLFQQLTQEDISEGRALAVANYLPDHNKQDILLRQVKKSEDRTGRFMPDATVAEMARELDVTPSKKKADSGDGPGLFADDDWDEPLIAERAHLKAFLRRSLTGERNTFKAASSTRRQSTLQSTGENKIDVGANKSAAKAADIGLWDFDKRVNAAGDSLAKAVSDAAAQWSEAKGERERRGVEKSLLEAVNKILRPES